MLGAVRNVDVILASRLAQRCKAIGLLAKQVHFVLSPAIPVQDRLALYVLPKFAGHTHFRRPPMPRIPTAVLVLASSPLLACPALLAQQVGVSHPPEAVDDTAVAAPAPVATPPVSATALPAQDSSPAVTLHHRDLQKFQSANVDHDGDIVEEAPPTGTEIPVGTMLRARLQAPIHTDTTAPETAFTAQLTEPLLNMGRVIVPAGSLLQGRITEIHGGRRFRGAALIHLQAQTLVLPDGSRIPLNAAVIDTDQYGKTRIDSEGNIVRKDHAKETIAALSLTTGGAAAAGGVIAGPPGALIGAGIGAGVSTVWWLNQDRQTSLPAETLLVLSLTAPLPIQSLVREPQFAEAPVSAAAPTFTPAESEAPRYSNSFVPAN